MSEVEIHDKSWLEIKQENKKLKETIKKMANEIFIEYNPHFISPEAVIEFFTEQTMHCTGSSEDRINCREEKMGCIGCYYNRDKESNNGNKSIST